MNVATTTMSVAFSALRKCDCVSWTLSLAPSPQVYHVSKFPRSSTPTVTSPPTSASIPSPPCLLAEPPRSWLISTNYRVCGVTGTCNIWTYQMSPRSLSMGCLWLRTQGPLVTILQINVSLGHSDSVGWGRVQGSVFNKQLTRSLLSVLFGSSGIAPELVRNAESLASPQTCWIRGCRLKRYSGRVLR